MGKYSGPEDVYRELVDESEEHWLYCLIAFAIVEEQKIEWIKHYEEQYNTPPSPDQIREWYEQQPTGVLLRAKGTAENALRVYSDEVVEAIGDAWRKQVEEETIVGEIRQNSRFWPQFCINLVGGFAGTVLFASLLALIAFFVINDTSPVAIVTDLKANKEEVVDDKE